VRVGTLPLERREALALAHGLVEADPDLRIVLLGAGGRSEAEGQPRVFGLEAPPDEGPLTDLDAVVDLREPTLGTMLNEVLRWLSAGVPVAVGDFPDFGFLPDGTVERVRLGAEPPTRSVAAWLASPRCREQAEAGRRHVRARHSVDDEARSILACVDDLAPALVDRRVTLGRVQTRVLAARFHRALRHAVFRDLPIEHIRDVLPDFVDDVERTLDEIGLGTSEEPLGTA
jgi:hypothetical protein